MAHFFCVMAFFLLCPASTLFRSTSCSARIYYNTAGGGVDVDYVLSNVSLKRDMLSTFVCFQFVCVLLLTEWRFLVEQHNHLGWLATCVPILGIGRMINENSCVSFSCFVRRVLCLVRGHATRTTWGQVLRKNFGVPPCHIYKFRRPLFSRGGFRVSLGG